MQVQQLSGISNLFTFSAAVVRANGFDDDATAQVHAPTLTLPQPLATAQVHAPTLTLTPTLSHRAGACPHPHPHPNS